MKPKLSTYLTILATFVVGTGAATLFSGCQPSKPIARSKASSNTNAEPDSKKESKSGATNATDTKPAKPRSTKPAKPTPDTPKDPTPKATTEPGANPEPTAKPEVKPEVKPEAKPESRPTVAATPVDTSKWKAKPGDYPQWLSSPIRNNVSDAKNIPGKWKVGGFDRKTGAWKKDKAENIKWQVALGSQTYGNPVVAAGRIYVGTNNGAGYLKRYPSQVDLGCLLCINEEDGRFLWQHSSEKLPTGLVHDWPLMGICCAPYVEEGRLWFVTSRGEVRCLDTEGFYDNEDDGPVQNEWVKQFAVEPLVQAGLNDNTISESLSAQFSKAGIKIPAGPTVETVEEDKTWTISFRDGEDETKLQVRLDGTNLIGSKVAGDDSVKDIFTVDSRLTAGLEEGQLSEALRTHFALSGIELPPMAAPKAATAGKVWTVTAAINGPERQFRLKMAGPRLVCEKLLTVDDKDEADVVWVLDMMHDLDPGISQHNMCSCSITALGDILFVCTSNGVDETHLNVPAPNAPSFMALDKTTGKILWTDKSPGANIHHGQWSSPTVAEIDGVPQVLFGGGDGWLYSFRADAGKDGSPELLWKFDANPKDAKLILGAKGTRNDIIATPVVYDGKVYVATGQDPEHGEGPALLWCIDPTKRGDVSPWLAVKRDDPDKKPLPYRRVQAVTEEEGEIAIENPNSAVVWKYAGFDLDGDGKLKHGETMHRSCGSVAIKDGILFVADFSGLVHCLDAKTGKLNWTYDMLAASWGSPLIVDGKVYIGDEDGDVCVFELKAEKHKPLAEISMQNSVFSTPIVANGVLYIADKNHLFAIQAPENAAPAAGQ